MRAYFVNGKDAVNPRCLWAAALIAREHRHGDLAEHGTWLCDCRICNTVREALPAAPADAQRLSTVIERLEPAAAAAGGAL